MHVFCGLRNRKMNVLILCVLMSALLPSAHLVPFAKDEKRQEAEQKKEKEKKTELDEQIAKETETEEQEPQVAKSSVLSMINGLSPKISGSYSGYMDQLKSTKELLESNIELYMNPDAGEWTGKSGEGYNGVEPMESVLEAQNNIDTALSYYTQWCDNRIFMSVHELDEKPFYIPLYLYATSAANYVSEDLLGDGVYVFAYKLNLMDTGGDTYGYSNLSGKLSVSNDAIASQLKKNNSAVQLLTYNAGSGRFENMASGAQWKTDSNGYPYFEMDNVSGIFALRLNLTEDLPDLDSSIDLIHRVELDDIVGLTEDAERELQDLMNETLEDFEWIDDEEELVYVEEEAYEHGVDVSSDEPDDTDDSIDIEEDLSSVPDCNEEETEENEQIGFPVQNEDVEGSMNETEQSVPEQSGSDESSGESSDSYKETESESSAADDNTSDINIPDISVLVPGIESNAEAEAVTESSGVTGTEWQNSTETDRYINEEHAETSSGDILQAETVQAESAATQSAADSSGQAIQEMDHSLEETIPPEPIDESLETEVPDKEYDQNKNDLVSDSVLSENTNIAIEPDRETERSVLNAMPVSDQTATAASTEHGGLQTERTPEETGQRDNAPEEVTEQETERHADQYDDTEAPVQNETKFTVSVVDEYGRLVPGAQVGIFNNQGELLKTWVSTAGSYTFYKYKPGMYQLKLIAPLSGYPEDSCCTIMVGEDSAQNFEFVLTEPGVTVACMDENGDPVEQLRIMIEEDQRALSLKNGAKISGLNSGIYHYTVTAAPDGIAVGTGGSFEVRDNMQSISVSCRSSSISIVCKTEDGLDITDFKLSMNDENGRSTGEVSASDGSVTVRNIRSGSYSIFVSSLPDGYATPEHKKLQLNGNENEDEVCITVKPVVADIAVLDEDGAVVSGANMMIINGTGEKVAEWTSGETPVLIRKIAVGSYSLSAVSVPDGYINGNDISFQISDSEEKQSAEIKLRKTCVKISALLSGSSKAMTGAELQVINEAGSVVEDWVTDESVHTLTGLPKGNYRIKAVAVPNGFSCEEVPFQITDEPGKCTVWFYDRALGTQTGDDLDISALLVLWTVIFGLMAAGRALIDRKSS